MATLAHSNIVTAALIAPDNDDRLDGSVVAFRGRAWMSGSSREVGNIRETIGATHAKVDLLLEQTQQDRRERREAEERIWMELRAIKHDKANSDMLQATQLQMIDRRQGEIERRVGLLEKPVQQFVQLKARLVWLGGLLAGAIVLLTTLGKPFYDAWIAGWFSKGK